MLSMFAEKSPDSRHKDGMYSLTMYVFIVSVRTFFLLTAPSTCG
jgi:hypothetical protein